MGYDPTIDYSVVMADERFASLPASVRKDVARIVKMQQQKATKRADGTRKNKNRRRAKLAKASRKRNRR